jgi:hypothetical protein
VAIDRQVYGVNVKQQGALGLFGMMLITLGLYAFWWTHRVNREMRDFGRAYGDTQLGSINPMLSTIAVVIPFVNLVGLHRIGKRVQRVQELTGRGVEYSMGLHWLLAIFTGLWFLYAQSALSNLYRWLGTANQAPVAPSAPEPPVATAAGGPFMS